jgi:hypothetical protein
MIKATEPAQPTERPSTSRSHARAMGCMAVVAGLAAISPLSAQAQTSDGKAKFTAPLTSWGKPDLGGNWTNSSLTRLERDPAYGSRLEMTPEEVAKLEGERKALVVAQGAPTDVNAKLADVVESCDVGGSYTGASGPRCGYNGAWTDPGDVVMRVGGKPRTSFITSTPDGRVPARKAGAVAVAERRASGGEGGGGSGGGGSGGVLPAGVQQNDNPEGRSLGERCIMSFGYSSGPVMQPQLYNSNYQFVQTKDTLAIVAEMVHDVRQIRIGGKHRTDGVREWMGDSIGRWEGNTLVAETINFHPEQRLYGASKDLKVTERFTAVGPGRMHYEFKVEDPAVWEKPWSGEYEFFPAKGHLYEYACHEGNYGLENILAGARTEEAQATNGRPTGVSSR